MPPSNPQPGCEVIECQVHRTYDLKIYLSGKLESVYIEIMCPKSSNVIAECLYRHPNSPINEFKNEILLPIL